MTIVAYQIIDFILIHKVLLAFIIPTLTLSYFTVTARSPIHSILSLIVTFLMVAFIFIMYYSLPFIGTLLIVIYVGAIAILFLFVIMMIPMRDKDSLPLTPIPAIVNFVIFAGLLSMGLYLFLNQTILDIFVSDWLQNPKLGGNFTETWEAFADQDLRIVGEVLYKRFSLHLVLSIILLFLALVIAIILCEDRLRYLQK